MKVKIKKKLSYDSNVKLGDIVPDVASGIYENEYLKFEGSRADVIEISDVEYIECALSTYVASIIKAKLLRENKARIKYQEYKSKLTELESKIVKLRTQDAIGAFVATAYLSVSDSEVGVGYNGSRLFLIADMKTRKLLDGRSLFNPYDIPFEQSVINNPVPLPIFIFDRHVTNTPSKQVLDHICSRPVQFTALSSFISALSFANTKLDLDGVINSSITLYGKIEKLKNTSYYQFDDDIIKEEDIEFVPRSLEQLLRYGGYSGTMPFIDAPIGSETVALGSTNTIREVTAIEYIVRSLRGDLTNDIQLYPSYKSLTVGDKVGGLRALATLRSYTRTLIGLYKAKDIRKSLNVDLSDCIDDIARNSSVNL